MAPKKRDCDSRDLEKFKNRNSNYPVELRENFLLIVNCQAVNRFRCRALSKFKLIREHITILTKKSQKKQKNIFFRNHHINKYIKVFFCVHSFEWVLKLMVVIRCIISKRNQSKLNYSLFLHNGFKTCKHQNNN